MPAVNAQQLTLRECVRRINDDSPYLGLVARAANTAQAIKLFNQTDGLVDPPTPQKAPPSPAAFAKDAMTTVTDMGTRVTDLREQIVAFRQIPAALKEKWAPFFQHFSLAKQSYGLVGKVLSVPKTFKECREAQTLDHQESVQRVAFSFGSLVLGMLIGFISIAGKLKNLELAEISEELLTKMESADTLLSGLVSLIGLGFALRGIQRYIGFQQKLHVHEKDVKKLEFLLASVTVSEDERQAAGASKTSWAKCKLRHVQTRTSVLAVREILANAPRLITALDEERVEPPSEAEVAEAKKLIALVHRESQKKLAGHVVSLAIATFSLIGLTAIGTPFVTASMALGLGSTLVGFAAPTVLKIPTT